MLLAIAINNQVAAVPSADGAVSTEGAFRIVPLVPLIAGGFLICLGTIRISLVERPSHVFILGLILASAVCVTLSRRAWLLSLVKNSHGFFVPAFTFFVLWTVSIIFFFVGLIRWTVGTRTKN